MGPACRLDRAVPRSGLNLAHNCDACSQQVGLALGAGTVPNPLKMACSLQCCLVLHNLAQLESIWLHAVCRASCCSDATVIYGAATCTPLGPCRGYMLLCFPAAGSTVEIHGNISQLVCPECGAVTPMNASFIRQMRAKKPIPCNMCSCQAIRCRVMLYGDADGEHLSLHYLLKQRASSLIMC